MADLDALFSMDPTEMSDEQFNAVIEFFRRERTQWLQEEAEAKAQGRPRKRKMKVDTSDIGELDLDLSKL